MTLRDREGLISRIRQIRRAGVPEGQAAPADHDPNAAAIHALEQRIAHLEQLVEGLQDSVHRESERQGRLIAELQAQIQPSTLNAALSKDARERGL